MLTPIWQPVTPAPVADAPPIGRRVLLAGAADRDAWSRVFPDAAVLETLPGDDIAAIADRLAALGPFDRVVWVAPDHTPASPSDETLLEAREQGVLEVFRLIKAFLALNYGVRDLAWTLVTVNTQRRLAARRGQPHPRRTARPGRQHGQGVSALEGVLTRPGGRRRSAG